MTNRARGGKSRHETREALLAGEPRSGKSVDLRTSRFRPSLTTAGKLRRARMFFALRGEKLDGVQFVEDAIRRGAIAVATEDANPDGVSAASRWSNFCLARAGVACATAAANFYGRPAEALRACGRDRDEREDHDCLSGGFDPARGGTYDGLDRHDRISHAGGQSRGREHHAGVARPAADVRGDSRRRRHARASWKPVRTRWRWTACGDAILRSAIFTNLTRDHLDYHKTFDEYFAAKRRLFEGTGAGPPDVAVINADDPYAPQLAGSARRTLTYGLKRQPDLSAQKFASQLSRPGIHGANAGGKHRSSLAVCGADQRLQHSGGDRRGNGARHSHAKN